MPSRNRLYVMIIGTARGQSLVKRNCISQPPFGPDNPWTLILQLEPIFTNSCLECIILNTGSSKLYQYEKPRTKAYV